MDWPFASNQFLTLSWIFPNPLNLLQVCLHRTTGMFSPYAFCLERSLLVFCSIISNLSGPATPRRKSNGHAAPVSPGSDELTDDYVSLKPIRPPPPLPNHVSPGRHPLARQSSKVVAAASRTYATLAAFQGKILIIFYNFLLLRHCWFLHKLLLLVKKWTFLKLFFLPWDLLQCWPSK